MRTPARMSEPCWLNWAKNYLFAIDAELRKMGSDSGSRKRPFVPLWPDIARQGALDEVFRSGRPEIVYHVRPLTSTKTMEQNICDAVTNDARDEDDGRSGRWHTTWSDSSSSLPIRP